MLNFGNKEFRNLQEQVLKNAQDIETLKGREDLQIVIVNELPEVGNPNYIYLLAKEDGESPDVYEEYIWLEDEERYEIIGGVSIDLTNYVTLNTDQTITGTKTLTSNLTLHADSGDSPSLIFERGTSSDSAYDWKITDVGGELVFKQLTGSENARVKFGNSAILPMGIYNLGDSSSKWNNLYLSGNAYFNNDEEIQFATAAGTGKVFYIKSTSNTFHIGAVGIATSLVLDSYLIKFIPASNSQDFGDSTHYWRDLYILGSLKDGENTVSVADISTKTTSTYASGTFDSNGESTIDISGGISEGLYIFSYGNCQCFVHLTSTMIQNADLTPIRVSCPMMYNSLATSGWLAISRSSDTLTITIVNDAHDHVDSGYAWTLTQTKLL